jgi:septum formation protein
MPDIILASQSPRRYELLTAMGVSFKTVISEFDEYLDDARSPEEVATELALGKAQAVAAKYPNSIVIGSDTIATIHGKQLEKPKDEADAYQLLQTLAGDVNEVSTGLAVIWKEKDIRLTGVDTSRVFFKPFNEAAVTQYITTGDPMDKAGAYGIQSGAAPLIDHIEGHLDTVIGLPTTLLAQFLSELGVNAQAVEIKSPLL